MAVKRATFLLGALPALFSCSFPSQQAVIDDVNNVTQAQSGYAAEYVANETSVRDRIRSYLDDGLNCDTAVKIALLNNQTFQAGYEKLGISRGELIEAGLLKNPVFEAEVHFEGGGIGKGTNLNILEKLISVFQLPLRRKVAEDALTAAQYQVAADALQLIYDTEAACYMVQGTSQLADVKHQALLAHEASVELAQRQSQAGNITRRELLQRTSVYANVLRSYADAQANLIEAREKLNVFMGLWGPETNWEISDELPAPPATEISDQGLQALAVSRRPELLQKKAEIEQLGGELGITEDFRLLPNFTLGFDVEGEDKSRAVPGPNLSFPIPIFNQGQGMVAQAAARLRQAQREYAAQAVTIRSDVRTACMRLDMFRKQIIFDRKHLLPLSEGVIENTQTEYNAMLTGGYELLQTKLDALEAQAMGVEALKNYWMARSSLEKAIGGKLPETGDSKTLW